MNHTVDTASKTRWHMNSDRSIEWSVNGTAHTDQIEMSGRRVSFILTYGTNDHGELVIDRQIVWPMLRTIPNNTHASLTHSFNGSIFPQILVDGSLLPTQKPSAVNIKGMVTITSAAGADISITRRLFPCTRKAAVIEYCTIQNNSNQAHDVDIQPYTHTYTTEGSKGVYGVYTLTVQTTGHRKLRLNAGKSVDFALVFAGRKESEPIISIDPKQELKARREYVDSIFKKLRFECPDTVLNREFDFAKLRAAESVYDTKAGMMHGPGGGAYYAAIWANDQAEYASPFFPFLGDADADQSALNCYRLFAKFMKPDYKAVPSSIIAEATDIWAGAGDRGDAAMIGYGAARYALVSGNQSIAHEMWPIVTWCLEYCRRKTNSHGVVESDSDELEGRFPAGKANLCTSALYYDALISAAWLGEALGKPSSEVNGYRHRAEQLSAAIERFFGADIQGFHTYRYYDGNTTLRAWICIPLTMGIFDRKQGTINALFSPKLWTEDGLATEAGQETFWDRATLYALRGVFATGDTKLAMDYLQKYSIRRLLGDHVPYPVEAWPEGNQRHLSAESALYCRIITEGLWGIRPVGLNEFMCTPRLPDGWGGMALRSIQAFGKQFDLMIKRKGDRITFDVLQNKQRTTHEIMQLGDTIKITLK